MKWNATTVLGTLGLFWTGRTALRHWQASRYDLRGRVVVITGGSRGLGLLLAREYARLGCKLALVARDANALERACAELRSLGTEVLGVPCDITDEERAREMVEQIVAAYGRIDVLVNDAGRIEVGPLSTMTTGDFMAAMDTNFWGAFNVIHHALAHLESGQGRIVKGDAGAEYAWFSIADSLPLLSMQGRRAARQIVSASRRGDVLLVLGLPAKLAAFASALLPSLTVRASALVTRALPHSNNPEAVPGRRIGPRPASWLTALGDRAATENNELG